MAELEVVIDGRPAKRGSEVVVRSLDKMRKAARQNDAAFKRTEKTYERTRKAALSLRKVIGALAVVAVARGILSYADSFQTLTNRLRLVTDSTEQLTRVQEEVFEIAQKNRIGFESTAELFQRVARSSEELGLSLQRVLNVTDSVSKAITISGVSAQSANAAIVQLGQGLAAGALRGDELRSVLEQTPRLARAIADGMGIAVGQLREYGSQGKLSAEAVVEALESQAQVLEDEFERLGPTIGQGFTVLRNSLIKTVGVFTTATGAAGGFANGLIKIAGFISGPMLEGVLMLGDVFGVVFKELGRVKDVIVDQFDGLGIEIGPIIGDIGRALIRLPLTLLQAFEFAVVEIRGFMERLLTDAKQFQNALVGTLGVITGNDAVVEQAIMERIHLQQQEEAEALRLAEAREALFERFVEQENDLREAIEARAQARRDAAEVDLALAEFDAAGPTLELSDEGSKILASLAEQEEALARAAETGIEYSRALELIRLEAQAAKEGRLGEGFLADATAAMEEIDRLTAVIEAQTVAQDDMNRRQDRAREIFQQTRTDAENLSEALEELEALALEFPDIIDEDTLTREQERLREEFTKTTDLMQELAQEAARNMQNALADFFFDPTQDGIEGLVQNFADALRRMAAEAAAQKIFEKLFGGGFGGDGGGGGGKGDQAGALVGFLGGIFGGGGGGFSGAKAGKGFATGGSFMVTGSGGADSQVVAFRATPGERVTVSTPTQQSQSPGGPTTLNQTFVLPPGSTNQANLRETQAQLGSSAFRSSRRAYRRNN